jgi:hypothetical protein
LRELLEYDAIAKRHARLDPAGASGAQAGHDGPA